MKKLLEIMRALRDENNGCPWDIKQNYSSIAPYTLEEAYELVDAIENNDMHELKSELGDLLYHIVFYSQLAAEAGDFDFQEVVESISQKLISRHPHVFSKENNNISTNSKINSYQLESNWENAKAKERDQSVATNKAPILHGIAKALPGLKRAQKLQKRAAREGFDWLTIEPVINKIEEELHELRDAMKSGDDSAIFEEMGDLIFSCVNLSRHLNVDAEEALKGCNKKFIQRFNYIENSLKHQQRTIQNCGLEELEILWREAKDQPKLS